MKIAIGTCILAALLVVGTACGGDEANEGRGTTFEGGTTFQGDGFSFDYPAAWQEREFDPTEGGGVPDVTVGPEGRPLDSISVQVTDVGVKIEGKDLSISEENIDENAELLSIGANFVVSISGGKLGKRQRVTVGGLPGFRWQASDLIRQASGPTRAGGRVNGRITHLFKGLKGYLVSCLYAPVDVAEVTRACDQALGTFRLTSGD